MAKQETSPRKYTSHIGRDNYLFLNIYQDRLLIHVRQMYTKYPKQLFPTKNGITLTKEEFNKILDLGETVKKQIHNLESENRSSSTDQSNRHRSKHKTSKRSHEPETVDSASSSSSSDSDQDDKKIRKKKIKK